MNYTIKQRKSRTQGHRLLSLRFKFREGTWNYSMNIKVKEGSFNSKSKEISNDLESTIRLRNFVDAAEMLKLSLLVEGRGNVSKDLFVKRFKEELVKRNLEFFENDDQTKQSIVYLTDYIEDYVSTGERLSKLQKSTSVTYRRLNNKITAFDSKWNIASTDQVKLKAFRLFLIGEGLKTSTINLMLVRLKTILKNFERYDGVLSTQIVNSPHLDKMKEVRKRWVYLSLEELDTIYNLKIEDDQLSKARDLLLIGCYTALRVSDWAIKPNDISEDRSKLTYRTQKTGSIVEIPLFDKLKVILERNNWSSPVLIEGHINPLFKELCKMAGITRSFKNYEVYPERTKETVQEAWQLVTSHTCRRSFATNMYLKGVPVSHIRAYTTHANDKVFMNYVQATDTEVSQQVKIETLNTIFNNEQ